MNRSHIITLLCLPQILLAQDNPIGTLLIESKIDRAPPPLFYRAEAKTTARLSAKNEESTTALAITVLQGKADLFSFGLAGENEITKIEGERLLDWAVRQGEGRRTLEIRVVEPDKNTEAPKSFAFTVHAAKADLKLPRADRPLFFLPGKAVGFASNLEITLEAGVEARVTEASGLASIGSQKERHKFAFQSQGEASLTLSLSGLGATPRDLELRQLRLQGQLDPKAKHARFTLTGEANVAAEKGGEIEILRGGAAFSELPNSADYQLRLNTEGDEPSYTLRFPRPGVYPISLVFDAAVREESQRFSLDFTAPSGAVVPVILTNAQELEFDPTASVFPTRADGQMVGFLPASGQCFLAWKKTRGEEEGKLFFATQALEEIRVSAGLLRQGTALRIQVLQGKLPSARIIMEGPGEILAVEGENLLGWTLEDAGAGKRALQARWSQPLTGQGQIIVRSQTALGSFPARVAPLRLTPEGSFRHSGHARLANEGAVRLEVVGAQGLTQLAPNQFPSAQAVPEGTRQVFAYRYPSAERAFEVVATQILPEVTVSQVVVYELGETDRVIQAALELDIREAPLREWETLVPAEFAVVSVSGAEVADYIAANEAVDGLKSLKVIFGKAVAGRQLINLRLEQNLAIQAGPWNPRALGFPSAKAVRGQIGLAVASGYRLIPGTAQNLVELPLSSFTQATEGLQQAYRVREASWTAPMTVESLSQNIQADVFHLYSLREGNVYGSVLLNYFVVGAPATEWRLEAPEDLGNIAVEGENVQGWRREGNQLIAALHQPALGLATMLVTFEKPMSARGGSLNLGDLRPVNVQNERGHIQVVSATQVRYEAGQVSPGLLKLEPSELPAEFRLLAGSPSLAIYQYSSRPFQLSANITWFEPGQTVDQVVDHASLASRVSRDGQVATEATLYVKTRGQKMLRLRLPPNTKLWEVKVAGETVNARQDGDFSLIPMNATADPNAFVTIVMRLGTSAASTGKVRLIAPALEATTMAVEWRVTPDSGRMLTPVTPRGAELVKPTFTETGWEWFRRERALVFGGVLAVAMILAGLACARRPWHGTASFVWVFVGGMAFVGVFFALHERRPNVAALNFAAPILQAGEPLEIALRNQRTWAAMLNPWGLGFAVLGLALMATRRWVRCCPTLVEWLGWLLVAVGLLGQHGGAVLFFAWLTLLAFARLTPSLWRSFRRHCRERKALQETAGSTPSDPPPTDTPLPAATSLLVVALVLGSAEFSPRLQAEEQVAQARAEQADEPPAPTFRAADAMEQQWKLEKGRLKGTVKIRVSGQAGEAFLLLRSPATLTNFQGSSLRVAKTGDDASASYALALEQDGSFTGEATFELPVGESATSFAIPTGPAAVEKVEIALDQAGWEITSPRVVRSETISGLPEGRTGVRWVLGPGGEGMVNLRPISRDVTSEATEFFAETANLFVPGPGAVDGRHLVSVRPSRGQVRQLEFEAPAGFTVSEVSQGPVGEWRFDPESRSLRVTVEPAQSRPFVLLVETQRGLSSLPAELALAPLRVRGAAADVGMIGLGFGADAQPEKVLATDLTKVNLDDFVGSLLAPRSKDEPAPTLQQVHRYGGTGGALAVTVGPVMPEVRAETTQTMSLGDDRLVLSVDLTVKILRAGLFHLSFAVPNGLELEGASGQSLSHWTESAEGNQRYVTLYLKGRTMGDQKFALSFSGAQPAAQADWAAPKFLLREATRQTGQLTVTPGQGIRLQPASRRNVSQLDARELAAKQPGTLAFRLLQADWELKLGIDALPAWVTAQVLQEVTLREGQTNARLALRYRVENASVKSLLIELPVTADEEQTLRATGSLVADLVKSSAAPNLWEIRFQRAVIGATDVTIEYRRATKREGGVESVPFARPREVRQLSYWLSVRAGERLELLTNELGRGWQPADWAGVPRELIGPGDASVPAMTFRGVEPEQALSVRVRRHSVAEALKLSVRSGQVATVFSPKGDTFTKVDLDVEVLERSALRVRLPDSAVLFNATVNGESVGLVKDGDAVQFHVSPKEEGKLADVSFSYQGKAPRAGAGFRLQGPRLSVPLQNVRWLVSLPEGYRLASAKGDLERMPEAYFDKKEDASSFSYVQLAQGKRAEKAKSARELLDKGNDYLRQGEQQKAWQSFSRAANTMALEPASNEDARVQLREVRNAQSLMSLNARRQLLVLDNGKVAGAEKDRAEQIAQAAHANPLLRGNLNFDQQAVESSLQGNTAEETQALKKIAAKLVSQQSAAEPALAVIDPTFPSATSPIAFQRAVQVDGDAPLELTIKIARKSAAPAWAVALGIAGLALVLGMGARALRR